MQFTVECLPLRTKFIILMGNVHADQNQIRPTVYTDVDKVSIVN